MKDEGLLCLRLRHSQGQCGMRATRLDWMGGMRIGREHFGAGMIRFYFSVGTRLFLCSMFTSNHVGLPLRS